MDAHWVVMPVITALRSLPHVLDAQMLNPEIKNELGALEKHYAESAGVPIANLGIETILGRDHACVLIKTSSFRSPPMPSVFMVEKASPAKEASKQEKSEGMDPSHILSVGDKRYHIIGEELIGSRPDYVEEILWISKSFAMFPGRRTDVDTPVLFLLPPIPFPELEERCGELMIESVVSGSPCSLSDDYLRKIYGFNNDKSLGSLLVGFDSHR